MSTQKIGAELVRLCREGKNIEAIETLYDKNIVSVEAMAMDPMPATMEGIEAIKQKNQWFGENHEVHEAKVDGPFPHGDKFAVLFDYDVTNKASGERVKMKEVGLFTVANGKIAREEFYYEGP